MPKYLKEVTWSRGDPLRYRGGKVETNKGFERNEISFRGVNSKRKSTTK